MNKIQIRKRLEMRGRDDEDLVRRIDDFRRALKEHEGAILNIKWNHGDRRSESHASVLYHVPLTAANLEATRSDQKTIGA